MALPLELASVDENVVGIVSIITIFVVFPIVVAVARYIWRRGSQPAPQIPSDFSGRLIQMQQSIDAMAIEMERISENQRFVTRLLSERAPEALPRENPSSRSGRAAG